MTRIFLSYRRDDTSGHAGRLRDELVQRFGKENVFMDVDAIVVGSPFAERIGDAIAKCDVLLALIGRNWLAATDPRGERRLDDPEDMVRVEIREALEREVDVFPVLVWGADPPHARDLPDDIAALARRHAHELSDTRWSYDVGRLMNAIDRGGWLRGLLWRMSGRLGVSRGMLGVLAALAAVLLAVAGVAVLGPGGAPASTCTNLTIPADERAELARAAGSKDQATKGSVFYGECEGDEWAIASFPSPPGDGVFHRVEDQWEFRGRIASAGCEVPDGLRKEWAQNIC